MTKTARPSFCVALIACALAACSSESKPPADHPDATASGGSGGSASKPDLGSGQSGGHSSTGGAGTGGASGGAPTTAGGADAGKDAATSKDAEVSDAKLTDAQGSVTADAETDAHAHTDSGVPVGACQPVAIASPTFGAIFNQLLVTNCAICHRPAYFGLDLGKGEIIPPGQDFTEQGKAYGSLVETTDSGEQGVPAQGNQCGPSKERRVVPGDAVHSLIVQKLEGKGTDGSPTSLCGRQMPLDRTPMCESTIAQVQAWINAGARND